MSDNFRTTYSFWFTFFIFVYSISLNVILFYLHFLLSSFTLNFISISLSLFQMCSFLPSFELTVHIHFAWSLLASFPVDNFRFGYYVHVLFFRIWFQFALISCFLYYFFLLLSFNLFSFISFLLFSRSIAIMNNTAVFFLWISDPMFVYRCTNTLFPVLLILLPNTFLITFSFRYILIALTFWVWAFLFNFLISSSVLSFLCSIAQSVKTLYFSIQIIFWYFFLEYLILIKPYLCFKVFHICSYEIF